MKEIFEEALKGKAFEWAVVPTRDITFSRDLLKICESNKCGRYNKYWTCPPAVDSFEKQKENILAFSSAFVFTTKWDLEDSFDYEGMVKAGDKHRLLTAEMQYKFGKANPVYGTGGCKECETCAYPDPCKFPEKVYHSISAAGINVSELSKACGIRYNNGPNTTTYFSFILFNSEL